MECTYKRSCFALKCNGTIIILYETLPGVGRQGFIQDFELGGEQDGSRVIVVCESMFTHV